MSSIYHKYCSCVLCHTTLTIQNLNEHYTKCSIIKHCPQCDIKLTNNTNKFCSRTCAAIYNNTHRIVNRTSTRKVHQCSVCGCSYTPIKRRKTCSDECHMIRCIENAKRMWDNNECTPHTCSKGGKKSASINVKRSKDEIQLFDMVKQTFPDALANSIVVDGWDADVLVPSLSLAIMWNGPWHYKEMGIKGHSLSQVQTRDKIKQKLIIKAGYDFLVFEDRHYTPQTAYEHIVSMYTREICSEEWD